MIHNRYSLAGWLAVTQAILFTAAFGLAFLLKALGLLGDPFSQYAGFGPIDMLFLLFTAFSVYTLYMFRRLLHHRYEYHQIDTLITVGIYLHILFQISSPMLHRMTVSYGRESIHILAILLLVIFMIIMGIVNIFMATRLLKTAGQLNDTTRGFAILSLILGIAEASVVFTPLVLILVPVWCLFLGGIFLRERKQVESFC